MHFFVLASVLASLQTSQASLPTYEEYIVYSELENQLLSTENGPFNAYKLAEVFYPKVGPSPICVPITYTLICPNAIVISNCTKDPIPCTETESTSFNASFLWSQYDLGTPIGPVLLSYAWNGITLRGFDWEDSCSFQKGLHFVLDIANITCCSGEVIKYAMKALSAVVRVLATCAVWEFAWHAEHVSTFYFFSLPHVCACRSLNSRRDSLILQYLLSPSVLRLTFTTVLYTGQDVC